MLSPPTQHQESMPQADADLSAHSTFLAAWARLSSRLLSGMRHSLVNGFTVVLDVAEGDPQRAAASGPVRLRQEIPRFEQALRAMATLTARLETGRELTTASALLDEILCVHGYHAVLADVAVSHDVDRETPPVHVDGPLLSRAVLLLMAMVAAEVWGRPGARLSIRMSVRDRRASMRIAAESDGAGDPREVHEMDRPVVFGPEVADALKVVLATQDIVLQGCERDTTQHAGRCYELDFAPPRLTRGW